MASVAIYRYSQPMQYLTEVAGPPLRDVPAASWLFDQLDDWTRRSPGRFAFAMDDKGTVKEYRFADVLQESDAIAAGLVARGIQPGDRIGILMENIPEWAFIILGAMRCGVITVPLATTYNENQLLHIAQHSGLRLLFTDESNLEKARVVGSSQHAEVVALKDWPTFQVRDPKARVRRPLDGEAAVLLIYTSGTTGDPKGVQLSMLNLIYEIRGIVVPLEIGPDHRILSVLPFSHVLPLMANALGPLCLGAGVVFLSEISPQRIVEAFSRNHINCFVCVPQFFYLLHKRIFTRVQAQPWPARKVFALLQWISRRVPSQAFRRKLFASVHKAIGPDLKLFVTGGSRFDARIAAELSELGYTMLNAYGLTETSAAITATPIKDNRIGSVGKPIEGVGIRIQSPNSEGIGEVCIRGPQLMKGYYLDDQHTAEAIRDGWYYSGDLGFIDKDGNLTITGRSKDVIVLASGKNIYPEEIETHYAKSPYIKEIAVLGVSDEAAGPASEKLHAVVVPDMDEFRLRGQKAILDVVRFEMENLSKELPSYQRVLSMAIRNEPLPRTVTRKLKRFEIQAEEKARSRPADHRTKAADHVRFQSGLGKTLADQVRKAKADVGSLELGLNLELDLGFDSLARVELLSDLEALLGTSVAEEEAARIYTLGELLDALERTVGNAAPAGKGWSELLADPPSGGFDDHYLFKPKLWAVAILVFLARTLKLLGMIFFRLRWRGLENIPRSAPFMICPNHESFLDAPMLYAVLPARVIANLFSLGFSNYWEGPFSRRLAAWCNIVAIDSNANLVSAMQAGAVGLRRNKILLIFPEGTRSFDGHIGDYKKGAAILACELGVPILPVGINGAFESWPRTGGFRFHPIDIVFGKPIDPKQFAKEADPYSALSNHLRAVAKELTEDVTSGRPSS